MEIKTNKQKLLRESDELMDISRDLRGCFAQVEDVKNRLGGYAQLDGCKRALLIQGEAIAALAVRLTLLSMALQDIANIYSRTEQKNIEVLEGCVRPFASRSHVLVSAIPDEVIEQFNKLLNNEKKEILWRK